MNPDDRPIYDDRNYFVRGRAGYRPEPPSDGPSLILSIIITILGLIVIGLVVWMMMPVIHS